MVLSELSGSVAVVFQEIGNCRIFGLKSCDGCRNADFGEPGPKTALTRNKRSAACCAALLPVRIGEAHPFFGDPVDVRSLISHQSAAVAAEVTDPDVVSPDDEDIGLLIV